MVYNLNIFISIGCSLIICYDIFPTHSLDSSILHANNFSDEGAQLLKQKAKDLRPGIRLLV